MIKFFRKIRQKLLSENRFSKYLIYASGEIILVMIGILLALQVSNWNQQRSDRKLEIRYLSELILDLQSDSLYISSIKKYSDRQNSHKNQLIRFYSGADIIEDSLVLYFGDQWRPAAKFNPILTTLDEMKSTGTIGVIQNASIRRNILETYNYYSTHINDFQERYLIQQNALTNLVQSNAPNIFSDIFENLETVDITTLLNDFEVKNRFFGNSVSGFNGRTKTLQSKNKELLKVLRNELRELE